MRSLDDNAIKALRRVNAIVIGDAERRQSFSHRVPAGQTDSPYVHLLLAPR